MILVDTSVWIEFFRTGNAHLSEILTRGLVLRHPWVQGELLLGRLDPSSEPALLLAELAAAESASDGEVFDLISAVSLGGSGIGFVDAQLIASARLTPDARIWTNDKRLSAVCDRLGIAHHPSKGLDA